MFRGQRQRWGAWPAVRPEWERGAPATRGVSSENNQEEKMSREHLKRTTGIVQSLVQHTAAILERQNSGESLLERCGKWMQQK